MLYLIAMYWLHNLWRFGLSLFFMFRLEDARFGLPVLLFVIAYIGMMRRQNWSLVLTTIFSGGLGFFLASNFIYQSITIGIELHKRQYGLLVLLIGCYFLLIFVACLYGMVVIRRLRIEKKTEPENPLIYPQP